MLWRTLSNHSHNIHYPVNIVVFLAAQVNTVETDKNRCCIHGLSRFHLQTGHLLVYSLV